MRDKQDSQTAVGVDVNEDNVALTALSEVGVKDMVVIEFPEISSSVTATSRSGSASETLES